VFNHIRIVAVNSLVQMAEFAVEFSVLPDEIASQISADASGLPHLLNHLLSAVREIGTVMVSLSAVNTIRANSVFRGMEGTVMRLLDQAILLGMSSWMPTSRRMKWCSGTFLPLSWYTLDLPRKPQLRLLAEELVTLLLSTHLTGLLLWELILLWVPSLVFGLEMGY
jgi:hypothetical protein